MFLFFRCAIGILLLWPGLLVAQQATITGTVTDQMSASPIEAAHVGMYAAADTTLINGTATGEDGSYRLTGIPQGRHLMIVSYLGYERDSRFIEVEEDTLMERDIALMPGNLIMDEVVVTARVPATEMAGDTLRHNAAAYRFSEHASLRELIRLLPGFEIIDGQIVAEGEEVDRILVDGEEFFGGDVSVALANLPAEIIERVELFDRQSDQARFTGFDDGEEEKAVNIVIREDRNTGRFGRAETAGGTDSRYMGGGNFNYFRGDQRVSLIGLTNNINQQRFASEDMQEMPGGRRGSRTFRTGGQSGIAYVHSLGANYTDYWGSEDQIRITGNFLLDMRNHTNEVDRHRRYTTTGRENQFYREQSYSDSDDLSPRMDLRVEYEIDDDQSLRYRSRLRSSVSDSYSHTEGNTMAPDDAPINELLNESEQDDRNVSLAQSLLYRRQLGVEGRTFSVDIDGDIDRRSGNQATLSEAVYYGDETVTDLDDQQTDIATRQNSIEADVNVTEPVGEDSQVMLRWNPSYAWDYSVRETYLYDETSEAHDQLSPSLSNTYRSNLHRQRLGARYRTELGMVRGDIRMDYQYSLLRGQQEYPFEAGTRRVYHNLMPGGTLRLDTGEQSQLYFRYRSRTRAPSATQLMDGIDNSNPLRMRGGNPELEQEFSHSLSGRFRFNNREERKYTSLYARVSQTNNSISRSTFVAREDTVIQEGVNLRAGSQLTRPENVGTSRSVRTGIHRGFPAGVLESNINLNAGLNYQYTPIFVNDERSRRQTWGLSSGFRLTSNLSERLDLLLSYNASYQIVDEETGQTQDDNYYTGRARLNFGYETSSGFTVGTEAQFRHYHGLDEAFNRDSFYWNVSAGYRFLENNTGHLEIRGRDLLRQNDSINRVVTENYVEDVQNEVLSRFFMLTFTYNFRSFPQGEGPPDRGDRRRRGRP